ncbi:MAG: recombinase family protein [Pirellulales bacterium]|nr:recombinase family protein [Pirellulales bacterium]
MPPKALHETLKYRPSMVAERVKTVQRIFKWYTTENVSAGQIARRLNDLGIAPVYSPLWHQGVIKYILANPVYTGHPTYNKQSNSRFMEFSGGQVRTAERKPARPRDKTDQVRPEQQEFKPLVAPEVFEKAQAKLTATKTRTYRAPKTAHLWLKGFLICSKCDKPMRAQSGNKSNGLAPGYICSEYARWGTRNPTGCGHFRVEHDEVESLVFDYLVEVAPQLNSLSDATQATDLETARPLLAVMSETKKELGWTWYDMAMFAEKYLPGKARWKAAAKRVSVESLYDTLYSTVKPTIEKTIAEKEAELEALLDGFSGLSPRLKERANQRGEAIQKEIDALKRDLADLRIPWERLQANLKARQEALERATTTLNQEGIFRQKAEVLRTVIDRIVCRFSRSGKRCTLKSIDVYAAKEGAVRPLSFPVDSLQMDSRLRPFVFS